MDFVAIDFETANASRDSICSIGLVTISNGTVIDEYYRLVKPQDLYFDPYNVEIHGITENMVKDAPTFAEIWPEILPKLQGKQVIAHYAQFDMSVLRSTLSSYGIAFPEFEYLCTWVLAKKAMPELINYRLDSIAKNIGFEFEHHNALDDAKACAAIFIKIIDNKGNNFIEIAKNFSVCCGKMQKDTYLPCSLNESSNKFLNRITATNDEIDTDHYFYGKKIAFTGTLISMPRKDAVQKIVNKGAEFASGITKTTNILVFGYQDTRKFADNVTNSAKFIKAQKLRSSGVDIEIINEDDFIKILES